MEEARRRWPFCPQCENRPLDPLRHGRVEVDLCQRCGGLWFEPGELRRVLRAGDATHTFHHVLGTADQDLGAETARSCADCGAPLWRHRLKGTGVEIEVCGECDGVWLESGALERLEYLRDGEGARHAVDQPLTREHWFFQAASGLPVEFNVPPRRFPVVTVALIVVNVLVFLVTMAAGGLEQFLGLTLVPSTAPSAAWWGTLFTSQFLHVGLIHLLGNMYFLYVCGDNLEDALGRLGFLAFYLGCGCIAGAAQTLAMLGSDVPMVGASGAIAGVSAGYAVIFRRARMTFMVFFLQYKISVLWYWGLWVAFNVVGAAFSTFSVGWFAHLGGFAAGLAIAAALYRRVLEAHPVIRYLNEGAYLARRFRRRGRRRRRSGRAAGASRS